MANRKIIYKILKELSNNSRIKKKEIAKKFRISPQMVSYTISNIEKDKTVKKYTTNIDPARFGLINIYVFISYTKFEKESYKKVKEYILNEDYITYTEELSHGADLLIEYTVSNLSFFNKRNIAMLDEIGEYIEVISVNPVIVKHQFTRDYLNKSSKKMGEQIFSGDREPINLSKNARSILLELWDDPIKSIFKISESTNLNVRTVLKIMKLLEDEKVIRSYSIDIDYKKLEMKSAILLVSTKNLDEEDIRKLIVISKNIPEIVSVTKVIGTYGIIVKIESIKDYENIIDQIRKEINFHKYFLYDSRNVIKNDFIPRILLK